MVIDFMEPPLSSSIRTLAELFDDVCRRRPNQFAYGFVRDTLELESQLTYGELEHRVRSFAGHLARRAQPGARALLLYPPGLDVVCAFWACMCAGLVPVPAPGPDPVRRKHGLPRLRAIIEDAQVSLVLTNSGIETFSSELLAAKDGNQVEWLALDQLHQLTDAVEFPHIIDETALAYLQYTSGSTATPRGVMVSQRNVLSHCKAMSMAGSVSDQSRSLCWLPYFHDYGLLHGIIAPFYAGIPAYLMSPITFLRRPLRWLEAVSQFSITHSGGPNFAYESCLRAVRQQQEWQADLSTWMVASCGAEPIHKDTVEQFIETFGSRGFRRTSFAPAYGLAEATLLVTMKRTEAGPTFLTVETEALADSVVKESVSSERGTRTLIGCGEPLEETRVLIVNPTTQSACPADVVGEVWLAGAGIATGYWRRPKESASTFKATLAESGEGPFLRTGDLGFIHKGELFLTGRLKELIIVRGRNYYPHDLEWTAGQAHSGLRPGCGAAFSIESGSREAVVLVHEVEKKLPESDVSEVMSCIRRALADEYELEVHTVVLVKSGTIPRTSSGKVQRHACRMKFESGQLAVVEMSAMGTAEEEQNVVLLSEAPYTTVEKRVADIWQEVLGGPQQGRHANFFAFGGNSLLATQVVSRIQEMFSLDFPLRIIFDAPTIAQLAEHILIEQQRGVGHAVLPPIVVVPRTKPHLLSYSQQRMWVMYQLAPKGTAYNLSFASRQTGPLNKQWLRQAIDSVIRRHDSFRTTFRMTERGPVQIVAEWESPHWIEIDLQVLPRDRRLNEAIRLVEEEARTPFDLERGPLARFFLLALDTEDHILGVSLHHIIGDQWSFGIIGQEIAARYNALSQGHSIEDTPPSIQFVDFAMWQRRCLTDDTLRSQLSYWRQRLANLPVLSLPTDHPRPATQTYAGSYCAWDLPSSLIDRLKTFSTNRRVTVFMTLFACFQVLLRRWSGQTDFAVGVPIANRTQVMTEYLVGTFVNTLVLRVDLSEDPTFEELVMRVRDTALDAYTNQDFPFEKLVETLHVSRDSNHSPLVQVLFNVANAPIGEVGLRGLSWVPLEFDTGSAQFDVSLMVETETLQKVYLSFNTDLFTRQTAERMLSHFCALLQQALVDPSLRVSEMPMLSPTEEQQLLTEWNSTEADYPHGQCFPELFETQVDRTPDAVALSMGRETLRYGNLNARANQLARYLRAMDVRPGVVVGICLDRSSEMIIALLAVLKAGGAYVPLDPEYPRDRLRFMSEDAAVAIVLTSEHLSERCDLPTSRMLYLDRDRERIAQEAEDNLPPIATSQDLAYILYTSGSTGQPKGVEIHHRALMNFLCSMRQKPGCSAQDVMVSVTTLSFDIAGLELYVPLLVGARVEIASRAVAMDGWKLRTLCESVQPTIMQATPTTWRMLIEAGWSGSDRLTVLCGGEALPRDLAVALLDRSGAVWNMYGPTETTIWSTIERIEQADQEITIGRPIANTEIYILDQYLQPVPVGASGELYIGGHGLARGYRGRPEITKARFVSHPFSADPHAKLYRTGDVARYRPDGRIVHLGRTDHQVKIRGFRVELGEIEAVLIRYPAVSQVVVTAREDQRGLKQLVAYVVCQKGQPPSPTELRSFVQTALPDYMTPSFFVFLEALPVTANNKIDVRALPPPAPSLSGRLGYVEPRDRVEVQLTTLWQQVLEIPKVGIHDNFFDLGGHSLKAVQLFFLLEQVYGRHLPLATLFQAPTIAELAAVLSREQWVPPWQSLVAIQPGGTRIPMFAVPGVGGNVLMFAKLAQLLGPEQPFYGLQAQGLDGERQPFTSVVKMAAHYVHEILTVRPQGPYIIAGTCTGGVIAFEMAQQLRKMGGQVRLIMMESWHPSSFQMHRRMPPMVIWPVLFVWSKVFSYMGILRRRPIREWKPMFRDKLQILPALATGDRGSVFDENSYHRERVTQATFFAIARYDTEVFPGHLLNLIASKRPAVEGRRDTRMTWIQLAQEGGQAVSIPAENSGHLFVSPHVEQLSQHIAQYVSEAFQEMPPLSSGASEFDLMSGSRKAS